MDTPFARVLPRCRAVIVALAFIGVGSVLVANPQPDDEPAALDPITVTAPQAGLDRSLELLRRMVDQSAPCLGCDAVLAVAPRRPLAQDLLQYLLRPTEPPEVDEAARLAHDVKIQDSPDLEYLRP